MSCKCAVYDPYIGRYVCSITDDECMFLIPNSKSCAEQYAEGPDMMEIQEDI